MRKSVIFFLIFLNTLFAFTKTDDEVLFRLNIQNDKDAEKVFLFLEKLDLKKRLFEDWEIEKREKRYNYFYFDTDNLILYKKNIEAVLILNQSKKKFIRLKDTLFETKRYKKQKSLEEKHPLFGIVKRGEREEFRRILKTTAFVEPLKLKNLFNLIKLNWDIVISKDNLPYAIITLQKSILKDFSLKPDYYQIVFIVKNKSKINGNDYKFLKNIAQNLENRLQKEFFLLKKSKCENDYICDFDYFKKDVPFFEFAVQYPLFYYMIYVCIIGLIGVLILTIFKGISKNLYSP